MLQKIALFVVVAIACTACVNTQFSPRSAVRQPQVTESAVEFHDDDAGTLVAAGGSVVGTVAAQGGAYTSGGVLDTSAAREAARGGGTHFILSSRGVEYYNVTFAGTSNTNCTAYGNRANCNTTYSPPQTQTYGKPRAEYVVVRVPPENWADLPTALRPVPSKGFVPPQKPAPAVHDGVPGQTPTSASTTTADAKPSRNLSGLWVGSYGGGRIETIRIEHVGSNVNATKVTGDTNVPAGKPTFRAILSGDVGEGMGHVADDGYRNPRWVPGQLRVASEAEIDFSWIAGGESFSVKLTRLRE